MLLIEDSYKFIMINDTWRITCHLLHKFIVINDLINLLWMNDIINRWMVISLINQTKIYRKIP